MKNENGTIENVNLEIYDSASDYFNEYTKRALEGSTCTYEEALEAIKPSNHGKKLSDFYPDLKAHGL